MFRSIIRWIISCVSTPPVLEEVMEEVVPVHKPYDTTKLTQSMIDVIRIQHRAVKLYNCRNPKDRRTMTTLAKELNALLGLNKCVSSYAAVWNKKEAVPTKTNLLE